MRRLVSVTVALAITLALIAGGCAPTPVSPAEEEVADPIKIGTCNPLSGPVALWGVSQRRCAEMWADEVNSHGGLLVNGVRHPVELPRGDTQGDVKVSRTVAERLVYKEKVKFIVGPNIDVTYTAVGEICNPEKVIFLGATFDPGNLGPDKPYSLLVMWMAHQTGPIMYKYFRDNYDVKKMAFIQLDDPGGRASLELCVEAAEELGIEVVEQAFYIRGTTDMYPQATRVLAANPDLVDCPAGSPEELGLMCKALRELGYEGLISEETEGDVEVTCGVAGMDNCEGLFMNAGSWNPANASPAMQEYHDKYVATYGEWNPDVPTKLYANFILGAAIQKAGSITDTEAVLDAFHTMQLKTPYLPGDEVVRMIGQKEFGINSQIGVPLCLAQIQDGQPIIVYTHLAPAEADIEYDEPYEFIW